MGFNVNIKGLEEVQLAKVLERGKRPFFQKAGESIADELNRRAPTRKVNFQSHPSAMGADVESRHPGAKAMDRGAFIAPKRQALKFSVGGETVYTRKPVRIQGTNYVRKALSKRRKILVAAFEETFETSLKRGR